jgi:CHAT domain-containing protein/lipopolysaccharide biosynthesis regulator YciM
MGGRRPFLALLLSCAAALGASQAAPPGGAGLALWDGSYGRSELLEYSIYKDGEELKKTRASGDDRGTMRLLNGIGASYISWRRYDLAEKAFVEAASLARRLNDQGALVSVRTNLAHLYHEKGDYDKAIDLYRENLAAQTANREEREAASSNFDIGRVYQAWGNYDAAIAQFSDLAVAAEVSGDESLLYRAKDAVIETYLRQGRPQKALELCAELLALVESRQWTPRLAAVYTRNAEILIRLGRQGEALPLLRKALKADGKRGGTGSLGIIQRLSDACRGLGQYAESIDYANMALLMAKETEQVPVQAELLAGIGRDYLGLRNYGNAIKYLNDSVAIKERLRLTATGAARRDYLASQIETYQYLTEAYLLAGNPVEAFDAKELSCAKYMAEQIASRSGSGAVRFSGIAAWRKSLDHRALVISYSISEGGRLSVLLADSETVTGFQVETAGLLADLLRRTEGRAAQAEGLSTKRGIKVGRQETAEATDGDPGESGLETIIAYYRLLLSKPGSSTRGFSVSAAKVNASDFETLSRGLYELLIGRAASSLKGKERLIIIPDGSLGVLPFETLIAGDGSYLVEKYEVSYAQSLTVNELIAGRAYAGRTRGMLAFGGAVYDERSWAATMEGAFLTDAQTYALLDRGAAAEAYRSLGYAWANLPGTLIEATEIRKTLGDADLVTKEEVEEGNIKALSKKGELKRYRILHFATHGLVVPEVPELSALVLSQFKEPRNGEDGYLTMSEIVGLDLAADFVNLSACETGLGKIYRGEGVVGLTQSFIIAGAKGISVSLWSVDDESTKDFMIGMYRLAKVGDCSYAKAIAIMKRQFIKGETYAAPYYWAPFVYYGM